MAKLDNISLKQQNYVETIDELLHSNGTARVTDLAARLNVSLPSASEVVARLVKRRIAVRKSWHEIALTERGKTIAADLARRHESLRRFMTDVLAMDKKRADENACRAEHCIGPKFVSRLTSFADFVDANLPAKLKRQWLRRVRA